MLSLRGLFLSVLLPVTVAALPGGQSSNVGVLKRVPAITHGFVENTGQKDPRVRYYLESKAGVTWVTNDGLLFQRWRERAAGTSAQSRTGSEIEQHVVKLTFVDPSPGRHFEASSPNTARLNFLFGDGSYSARSFELVEEQELWRNITLKLYRLDGGIEHEFELAAGADPDRIKFRIEGGKVTVTRDGTLEIATPFDPVRMKAPVAFQSVGGKRREVAVRYVVKSGSEVSLSLGRFDRNLPLTIDPVVYSTYLGGGPGSDDQLVFATSDSSGNLIAMGKTQSTNFPTSPGVIQPTRPGLDDLVIVKFGPSGTPLFSTYLGGSSSDYPEALTLDQSGNIYVGALTGSNNWPVTAGAFQSTRLGSSNGAIAKITPDGTSILYATYLGGSTVLPSNGSSDIDYPTELSVDSSGVLTVIGTTGHTDFPTTAGAYQRTFGGGSTDLFVSRFAADGSLVYSTYIGGSAADSSAFGTRSVLSDGRVAFLGLTTATGFPVTSNAFQAAYNGGSSDMVVGLLSADGASLTYATYFGSAGGDSPGGSIAQADGSLVVSAVTGTDRGFSQADNFPTTAGAYNRTFYHSIISQSQFDTSHTGVLFRLPMTGSGPLFSTTIGPVQAFGISPLATVRNGGLATDSLGQFLVGFNGNVYTPSWPVTSDAFQSAYGGKSSFYSSSELNPSDGVVALISSDGSRLIYGSFLGGDRIEYLSSVAVGSDNSFYFVGTTESLNFPVSSNAFQGSAAGGSAYDGFAVKISNTPLPTATPAGTPGSSPTPIRTPTPTATPQLGKIGSLSRSSAGNGGSFMLTMTGLGFASGASAQLRSGSSIISSDRVDVTSDTRKLSAIFSLTGVTPGLYDVLVTNPDGTTFLLTQGFTVTTGDPPNVSASIAGHSQVRNNATKHYALTVKNNGAADAFISFVYVTIPDGFGFKKSYKLQSYDLGVEVPGLDAALPDLIDMGPGKGKLLALYYPFLPAGYQETVRFDLTVPSASGKYDLKTQVAGPIFPSYKEYLSGLETFTIDPSKDGSAETVEIRSGSEEERRKHCLFSLLGTGFALIPFARAATAGEIQVIQGAGRAAINKTMTHTLEQTAAAGEVGVAATESISGNQVAAVIGISFAGAAVVAGLVATAPVAIAIGAVSALITGASLGSSIAENCFEHEKEGHHGVAVAQSFDPNDMTGPQGIGTERWIEAGTTVAYRISFENLPTAALAAARVTITDILDPALFDLASVRYSSAGFGDKALDAPSETSALSGFVELGGTQNLRVYINSSTDQQSGKLSWVFQLIDPSTGLPPEDSTLGFLPPNTTPPNGDGYVDFSVKLKSGLALGTQISNKATIVFDANASIDTPAWTNTVIVRSSKPLNVTGPGSFTQGAKTKAKTVTLSNPAGRDPILVTFLDPPDHFPLAEPSGCEFEVLRAGESCSIKLLYDPDSKKALSESLVIANTGSSDPLTVALKGSGAPGSLKPKRAIFPVKATKGNKKGARVTFSNTRNQQLFPSNLSVTAGFEVLGKTCAGALEKKKNCTVDLAFRGKKAKKGKLKVFDVTGKLIGTTVLSGVTR